MNISFKNKTILITGGSRGIGKKIKETYEQNGAAVIAPGRDKLDLSSGNSIENFLNENKELNPDIFVHCAGINILAGIDEINDKILHDVFQVNLFSAVSLLNKFTGSMKVKNSGKIVFISSLYSLITKERRIAYSASKNALTGLTKTLAVELGKYNILVNSVAPGYVLTDMTRKNLSDAEIRAIENNIPTGRFQTEEDIANIVLFLTSDFNSSITGQIIAVDGGYTCQ